MSKLISSPIVTGIMVNADVLAATLRRLGCMASVSKFIQQYATISVRMAREAFNQANPGADDSADCLITTGQPFDAQATINTLVKLGLATPETAEALGIQFAQRYNLEGMRLSAAAQGLTLVETPTADGDVEIDLVTASA